MNILRKFVRFIYTKLCSNISPSKYADEIAGIVEKYQKDKNPNEALEFLFNLDNLIYIQEGQRAIDYGNGLHVKHRLTEYHKFFMNNITSGSKVLDIGSGNGALAYEISNINSVKVTGIELREANHKFAIENYAKDNITFKCGDALNDLPDKTFDIIVLSNVLEHLKERPAFLNKINTIYSPEKILIRVPLFDREWRIPLKKELGLDWRSDKTHETEYTFESFENEITEAGLKIESIKSRWGEIYAVIVS
ncbi:MAG: class I SAM-dependent methyltransferase [Planctomycetota bacterium]|jgi:ubiquinone/menaquinone biosynthesis C-methylase UbiE